MASGARRFLGQSVPWRANIPWWVPLAEGIFALVVGVFLVFWTEESGRVILWAIGGFLLVNSVIWILSELRAEASRARLVRGGIGLIVGLLVVIQPIGRTLAPSRRLGLRHLCRAYLGCGRVAHLPDDHQCLCGLLDWVCRHSVRRLAHGLCICSLHASAGIAWYDKHALVG
jgi:drug/metabolite transporter superfamily protein YnfA